MSEEKKGIADAENSTTTETMADYASAIPFFSSDIVLLLTGQKKKRELRMQKTAQRQRRWRIMQGSWKLLSVRSGRAM